VLRVGVLGAGGRMGQLVCGAVSEDPGLELVAAVDPARAGDRVGAADLVVSSSQDEMLARGVEVAVDFTVPGAAEANALWCADNGVHAVIGTTGLSAEALLAIEKRFLSGGGGANCVVAPNFAIGAVLMMRFAELAAPWFDSVEVVELHHDAKLDAPSGTAVLTAERIAAARAQKDGEPRGGTGPGGSRQAALRPGAAQGNSPSAARGKEAAPGVQVHSVRLRGLVAHQEVLFGTTGQVLTIRHDSLDRSSFMAGVLLAVKQVPNARGFTLGLDSLLGL